MSFGSFDSKEEQFINEINMTPFVDVMLVLLIIFMITAPVLKHAVEVNLPQASSKPQVNKPEILNLNIDQNGGYTLDSKRLSEKELNEQLQQASKSSPQPVLHIYGDKKVEYDYVAKAMSLANAAGVEKVGFVTSPGK
ncbi:biopolymer transporter ExbD [Polynucleobacter sp.]|jgi:biopolymer transport protein ExbD|uniref:ExbD/TolR family protein n=1 Tax=Polynucleobacter sp. TaxID=2029855 RepID=UPI0025910571|nr:biopolymer transporter ExbD [Polynucleobacter sp.]MCX7237263.1 biopolymer transporter ExbD [Polynucleobacter sp.]